MPDYHLRLEKNRSKNVWLVAVHIKGRARPFRPSLGVPLDVDPTAAFERFKDHILPDILTEHQAVPIEAPQDKQNPTLKSIFDWFLDTNLSYLKVADKTAQDYRRILGDFQAFAGQNNVGRVQQVSWPLVQKWDLWVASMRPRADTSPARRHRILALKHVFEEAADAGLMPHRLADQWNPPAKIKHSQFGALSLPDTLHFYALLEMHARPIYDPTFWIYLTGWLPSDVLDLEIDQIDLATGLIDRTRLKTGKAMAHPITPAMRDVILRNLPRAADAPSKLFLDPKGHAWSYETYKKRLEYFCAKHHTPPVRPRDLRKTFATHMARAGESPKVLKELMNHEKVETTLDYYVDTNPDDLRQAADRHHTRYLAALNDPLKIPHTSPHAEK